MVAPTGCSDGPRGEATGVRTARRFAPRQASLAYVHRGLNWGEVDVVDAGDLTGELLLSTKRVSYKSDNSTLSEQATSVQKIVASFLLVFVLTARSLAYVRYEGE